MSGAGQFELVEREADVAVVERALGQAQSGEGGVLAVTGVAGIGKTRLIEELRARGRAAGVAVLGARGSEVERDFGFGVARQLFESTVLGADERRRGELLAGSAALAAPVLGLPALVARSAIDPAFAAVHGLYWLSANLAADGPLVLAVDDAQWADPDSLRWLEYLARRIEGLPLLLAVAVRSERSDGDLALVDDPGTRVVRPRALSRDAVGALAGAVLDGDPSLEFAAACHTATGGNPFLLHELLRALEYEGVSPGDAAAGRIAELAPASVARTVLARVARLGSAAGRLAEAVAVLGDRSQLRHAAAVAELPVAEAAAAADALGRADILHRGQPLEFVHPIVRAAVYADMAGPHRTACHARAVRVLVDDGAEPASVAAQLLLTDPAGDASVVESLRAAARDALAQGSPQPAVNFLGRALLEPPPPDDRAALLRELARAEAQAGDLASAMRNIAAAIELIDAPRDRAQASRELAQLQLVAGRAADAVKLLERAIDGLAGSDTDLGLQLEADLARAGQFTLQARALTGARVPRFRTPADVPTRLSLAHQAMETIMVGRADDAAACARRALDEGSLLAEESADSQTFYMAANALGLAGDLELALGVYDDALADARARGSLRGFAIASCYRACVQYLRGHVAEAEADARVAIDSHPGGLGILMPVAVAYLVASLVERGRLEAATAAMSEHPIDERAREPAFFNHYLAAAARLALARRELGEASKLLLDCGRREDAWGVTTPALTQWRAMLAPALDAAGRHDEARRLAAEELDRASAFGSPRHIGVALRAIALVEQGEHRIAGLREAVATLEASPARLEHARALVELGATLRGAGQRVAAREPLRCGLEEARRCGATALAERAHQELSATGLRLRKIVASGVDELTASERRVAQMAAGGLSNREIAQALFVTVRTVETHLRYAYRKLDIHGRAELEDALRESASAPGSGLEATPG